MPGVEVLNEQRVEAQEYTMAQSLCERKDHISCPNDSFYVGYDLNGNRFDSVNICPTTEDARTWKS